MGKFTVEEINLMCVFGGMSRIELIRDINQVLPHLVDSEMGELAGQVLRKLERITDEEFAAVVLVAAE